MNRNEFNRFIVGIGLPGPADIEGLRELTNLFPWFHSAHLLLLKGLRENSDIRFDSQLKASALSVSDREVLYHYIYLSPGSEPVAEEMAETTVAADGGVEPSAGVIAEESAAPDTHEESAAEEMAEATVSDEACEQLAADVVTEESVEESAAEVPAGEAAEAEAEISEYATPAEGAEEQQHTPEETVEQEVIPEYAPDQEAAAEEVAPEEESASGDVPAEEPTTAETTEEQEVIPEHAPEQESAAEEDTAAGLNAGLRSREELVAEIEARLRELEMITREQISMVEAEPSPGKVDTEPFPADQTEPVVSGEEAAVTELHPATESEPETELQAATEATPEEKLQPSTEAETQTEHLPEAETEEEFMPEIQAESEYVSGSEPAPAPAPESKSLTGPVHEELLELLPDDTVTEKKTAEERVRRELTPADLIDRFISISPTIERIRPGEDQPVMDLSERGSEEETSFITETLAKIYVNQGYYTKAINIYQKLSLQYPEKSAYFAGRIEKIEELIK